jgi:hypothetical protein
VKHRPAQRPPFSTVTIIIVAVALHGALALLLFQQQTKDIVPYGNRPYVPPPDPPNFGSRTYRETDAKTGETYTVTEYVISTKLFMDGKNAQPGPPATEDPNQ